MQIKSPWGHWLFTQTHYTAPFLLIGVHPDAFWWWWHPFCVRFPNAGAEITALPYLIHLPLDQPIIHSGDSVVSLYALHSSIHQPPSPKFKVWFTSIEQQWHDSNTPCGQLYWELCMESSTTDYKLETMVMPYKFNFHQLSTVLQVIWLETGISCCTKKIVDINAWAKVEKAADNIDNSHTAYKQNLRPTKPTTTIKIHLH